MGMYSVHRRQLKILKDIFGLKRDQGFESGLTRDRLVQKDNRTTTWRYQKTLEEMISDGFVSVSGENIYLTQKGRTILECEKVYDIEIEKYAWDGIWHVVAYDIPEKYKSERDHLRLKLKELGFQQIQYSLWVFPYSCEEEIGLLVNELGLSNFVAFLKTNKIPFNSKYKKIFGL